MTILPSCPFCPALPAQVQLTEAESVPSAFCVQTSSHTNIPKTAATGFFQVFRKKQKENPYCTNFLCSFLTPYIGEKARKHPRDWE